MLFKRSVFGKKTGHSSFIKISFIDIFKWHIKYLSDIKFLFSNKFSTLSICTSDRVINFENKFINRVLGNKINDPNNLHIEVCKLGMHSKLIKKNNVISGAVFIVSYFFLSPIILFLPFLNPKSSVFINIHLFKYYANFIIARYFFKNIKEVVVVNSVPYYGLIRGFKERGVNVIEYQHGIIHDSHYGYFNNWVNSFSLPNKMVLFHKKAYELLLESEFSKHVKITLKKDSFLSNYDSTDKFFDVCIIDTDPHRKTLLKLANKLILNGNKVAYCLKSNLKINNLNKSVYKSIAETYQTVLRSKLVIATTTTVVIECFESNIPVKVIDNKSRLFWLNYGYSIPLYND